MHGGDQLRRRVGGQHAVGVDRLPPLVLDGDDLGPAPRGDVDHPLPEQPVDRDDDDVARAHRVDERRLHARRAGGRQRQGAPVRRPEDLPEPVGGLVEDPEEHRVEVTRAAARPRATVASGYGLDGSGSEQGAGAQRHARDATGARPLRLPVAGRAPRRPDLRQVAGASDGQRCTTSADSGRPLVVQDGLDARSACTAERQQPGREHGHRGQTGQPLPGRERQTASAARPTTASSSPDSTPANQT